MAKRRYWLMKSEPGTYSIHDLEREGSTMWDGVRNYQARNLMRDECRVGDMVLFYHSSAKPSGVAGLARVSRAPYPDPTQFEDGGPYHDPTSDPDDPRWILVDVAYVETFEEVLPLAALKAEPALADMLVVQKGQRLSVMPVEKDHFQRVCRLAGAVTKIR